MAISALREVITLQTLSIGKTMMATWGVNGARATKPIRGSSESETEARFSINPFLSSTE
jgi:hypothetical protein